MTQQVKNLTEWFKEFVQRSESNESLPLGIPGPSRFPGSQEEPIILSSDEEVKIKVEKSATSEMEIDSNKTKATKKIDKNKRTKKTASKTLSEKAKGKAPVRSSSSSDNSSSSDSPSSSSSSDNSSSSDSPSSPSSPFYFKKDMPKRLREALRVNKDISY